MVHVLISVFLVFVCGFLVFGDCPVARTFVDLDVVPDVVQVPPFGFCTVIYPSGATVNLGNELTPTQVKDIPFVTWPACDQYYTLFMIDPDVPSRASPTMGEFRHWTVGNIPGNDVDAGEVLAEYIGSAPPIGTGLHRYTFLVFEQPCRIDFEGPVLRNNSEDGRLNFSTVDFIEKYNLGKPTHGNIFLAQYDDYVPVIERQIGSA